MKKPTSQRTLHTRAPHAALMSTPARFHAVRTSTLQAGPPAAEAARVQGGDMACAKEARQSGQCGCCRRAKSCRMDSVMQRM